jgi:RNA polymerase sigma factor (sigma-70 family)
MMNGYTRDVRAPPEGLGSHARSAEPGPARSPHAAEDAPSFQFDAVYTEQFDFVCRSLRLLGVPRDGLEDAAQDVFGIVSRRLDEFVSRASIKTWIFAITQRVAANHRRTLRRKQRPLEPLSQPFAANDPSPEAEAEAAQAAALIQTFAEGLDDGHRAVLVLGLIESVPARTIAADLGVPVNTVYSRMRSVRQDLKAFLREHEVDT